MPVTRMAEIFADPSKLLEAENCFPPLGARTPERMGCGEKLACPFCEGYQPSAECQPL